MQIRILAFRYHIQKFVLQQNQSQNIVGKDSYCFQEFCERQHIKAKKGGRAKSDKYVEMRRTAARLLRSGKTKTYISELLQVSYRSVLRWLQGIKVQAAIMHLSELKSYVTMPKIRY